MTPLSRRTFLRGTGVALSLPLLDAMLPHHRADGPDRQPRRRMVAICTTLGLHAPLLFPTQTGRNYTLTPYLRVLERFRDNFTIFSGLSHPQVDGGHAAEASFLTAAPHPNASSFRNTISLDQVAAERMAGQTRFDYLALATGGGSLSWSRSGVRIPGESRPSRVFARLFLRGSRDQVQAQVRRLQDGQSIMDTVRGQAQRMQRKLGPSDRQKLDEYFTSVRELEQRLNRAEAWAHRPLPRVTVRPPRDISDRSDIIGRSRLMYDLIHLALQTDSTRLITLIVNGANLVPPIQGVTADHHNLSHHGRDPQKIAQLQIIETKEMEAFRDLLINLQTTREAGTPLLDQTMVLFGSNLGNASSHNTRNLPVLLAGGGFRHGQHLAFDRTNNVPLGNLYVMMLQRLGINVERFASSTGTIRGLATR